MAAKQETDQNTSVLRSTEEETWAEVEAESDDAVLQRLGYKPVLHRTFTLLENFATTFSALYFIGGVRLTFSTGILAGGPLAYWTSYLITCVFSFITAAVLAEICSSLPSAGSIYLWAAEAGGPRYGRLFGFIVAWWSTTAWVTFCASSSQASVNYFLSELTVFEVDFPSSTDDVKFRAVQWICAEIVLALAALINFAPPKYFRILFYASSTTILLDFLLNLIWLPIGAHNTWGFRSANDAFLATFNGTGASPAWNWCLSFFATTSILIGYDASGHVAEETKNASLNAAKGIFFSTIASGIGGFVTAILFLFCAPDPDTLFSFGSPQPFVPLYAVVLGQGGHIFMTIICAVALWFNVGIAILASSRLVFAIARDGVLPLSGWVSKTSPSGQPRNAVIVVWAVAALICCTMLPSNVAFTSLVSAAAVPSAGAYGLICIGRVFLTPGKFHKPAWSLGVLSRPFQIIAILWNGWIVAILFSPYLFPATAQNLNYAPIIMGAVTIFALLSYKFTTEDKWFPKQRLTGFLEAEQQVETKREQ